MGVRTTLTTAHNRAAKIANDPELDALGKRAAVDLDEAVWLEESHKAAEGFVYDDEVLGYLRGYADKTEAPPIHLTERYLKIGGDVAEKRVTQAGYRLGAVLKQLAQEPRTAAR